MYRTVQEALTNVRKHAPGSAIRVRLWSDDRSYGVIVENSRPSEPPLDLPSARLGLLGLRERAELLGGTLVAAPSGDGPLVPRTLELETLSAWIPKLMDMSADELAELPGVSPSRTHQIVPGALVAEACMDIFDLTELEICPWALREGVIHERLDQISVITGVR